jgi:hypothetical protein
MNQDPTDSTTEAVHDGPRQDKMGDAVKIVQLGGSFEAFGVIVDYLSRIQPFSRYDIGNFAMAVRQQLRNGHHLAAMRGMTVVGYAGWLLTSRAIAEEWLQSEGILRPVERHKADAAALTVVTTKERQVLLRLIRGARKLNPGIRVYFKRQYAQGSRGARKASVGNVGFEGQ